MAAAEYFSNAPMSQQASQPYQQYQQPPPYQSPQLQPVPQVQTPPQYQQQNAHNNSNVHFAPTPVDVQQRHSFSGQHRPSFSHSPRNSWNQPPSSNPYQQQNQQLAIHHPPQQFSSPHSSGYNSPNQRPQHLAPHMRPYANPNSSQFSLEHGYSSDPEPHRRRHKQKERKRSGSDTKHSRSTNKDAFLGAAGGGLIGDLIFPGLGTVGGAAIGYFGGKDYGRHRKEREEERAKAQKEWDAKYGHGRHHRDRSQDYSRRRDSSEYSGPRSRQHSYERRKDDY